MKILEQRVTSPFGKRINPINHIEEFHTGVDLVNDNNHDVFCGIDGAVRRSRMGSFGEGNYVQITTDYKGVILYHNYFHNKINFAKEGAVVYKNELIAIQGMTGNSTGVHSHFEIYFMEWDFNKAYAKEIIKKVKYIKIGKRIFLEPFEFEKFIGG